MENSSAGVNISDTYNGTNITTELPKTQWVISTYFALLACGSALNLVHTLALIRSRRNGILSLILQIALVDLCSFYVALTEILTLHRKTWFFPSEHCPFFKGTEVLINTLMTYLLVCFNFHAISLWNLHEMELKKNNKNPLTSCNDTKEDSNECLVTRQENRVVTIDYRKRKEDISIVFPTIFIWTVSLSLSVPNFTLSSTLKLKENTALCAVIDLYYGQVLQHSLLIFKIVLPGILLVLSVIILIVKLNHTLKNDSDNIFTKKLYEIRRLLILGIVLTILYILTSFQRHCLHFVHTVSYPSSGSMNTLKIPPLYHSVLSTSNVMYLAMLHYSGTVFRGVLCLVILPKFPQLVVMKVFPCCKKKK